MIFRIFIEPHERYEALEAYKDWLSADQVAEIEDAPEGAMFSLVRDAEGTKLSVIEEG
jgi:hypothetical protein